MFSAYVFDTVYTRFRISIRLVSNMWYASWSYLVFDTFYVRKMCSVYLSLYFRWKSSNNNKKTVQLDVNFKFSEIGHMSIFINSNTNKAVTNAASIDSSSLSSFHLFQRLCVFMFAQQKPIDNTIVLMEKRKKKQIGKRFGFAMNLITMIWLPIIWWYLFGLPFTLTLHIKNKHTLFLTYKIENFQRSKFCLAMCLVRYCLCTYSNSNQANCWNSPHCVIIDNILCFQKCIPPSFFTICFC